MGSRAYIFRAGAAGRAFLGSVVRLVGLYQSVAAPRVIVRRSSGHFYGIRRFDDNVVNDRLATYAFIEHRHIVAP
jgi:hypothetical protein